MSNLYTVEKKIVDAHHPRYPGSTVLEDDRLKIVYNKFTTTIPPPEGKIRINIVFSHGTGMNKELWNYHIKKLYAISSNSPADWYLGSVVAFDCVSHGDSALINKEKLGWTYGWSDGARDLIKLVQHENNSCNDMLNNATSKTIIIGHSLGGHHVIMAGYWEPQMFDTIIPIEAVYYHNPKMVGKFTKLFVKIGAMLMDEFDSFEEFKSYYADMSFYKTLHPEVKKDLIENEYYTVFDPESQTTKYRSKASKLSQFTTYISSAFSIEKSHNVVPFIETKICFIVGEKATWNPPESIPYFIEHAKPKSLLEHHIVKNGTHLVNGDLPDEMVSIFEGVIKKRSRSTIEENPFNPEIYYQGDRKKILEDRSNLVFNGKIIESMDYANSGKPQL